MLVSSHPSILTYIFGAQKDGSLSIPNIWLVDK